MKSRSYFGLAIGIIVLLSNQVFAGEVTHWIDENAGPIYFTSVGGGTAMFVVGGATSEIAWKRMEDAEKRLGSPAKRESLVKQANDAEREYQTEKAKLEKNRGRHS